MFTTRILSAVIALFAATSVAHATCGPFPKSNYLGNFSHEQIQSYVERSHGGDWAPYLAALQANVDRLRSLQVEGKGTVLKVRSEQVELSPRELSKFVFTSRQFLQVAQCLADDSEIQSFADFATAAGGDNTPRAEQQTTGPQPTRKVSFAWDSGKQTANVPADAMRLRISSKCEAGDTVFTVMNLSGTWPKTGTFQIFRMDGPNRQVISARKMRLDAGETKTLKVKRAHNLTGHVGLAIDPSWYKRPFQIDGDARCS